MIEIKLSNTDKVALIDDEDYELVKGFNWKLNAKYVRAFVWNGITKKITVVAMHRLIMNCPKGLEVDHEDRNKLNCQRYNLRICTHSQNTKNRDKQSGRYTSKYKGVSKLGEKWASHITHQNKIIYIGSFDDEIQSALAYNEMASLLHGEFANLNNI